jgi:DNA-binding MarR family transcriptional regulator/GNAT superfamily N-acetyltransferase
MIAEVRRFSRLVTERVGALNDHYLARDLPLGQARVLWEIGTEGCDVRTLRSRLGLDSGYLSRLLRELEGAGLAVVEPSGRDRRVRTAHLTAGGMRERALLDRRSDDLARSLLEPLPVAQRDRLVRAMGDVERLLTSAMVEIHRVDPADPRARFCVREYFADLDRRFSKGFDPGASISADDDELRPPRGLILVATLRDEPVGCGALKFHRGAPTELKRMWVAPSTRGVGIGRRLLAELEGEAARRGGRVLHLETNRSLTEAIALYRSSGYREVEPFNDEPYADHWFEKRVPDPITRRRHGRRPSAP